MPPPIDGVGVRPPLARNASQLAAQENARLLAALIKALPDQSNLQPATIRQILSDPVQLSLLIRQAGLQAEMLKNSHLPEAAVLKGALHKVAPQHLEALLAALDRNEQPAMNMDESYGEPASFQSAMRQPEFWLAGHHLAASPGPGEAGITLDAAHFESGSGNAETDSHRASGFPPPPFPFEPVWRVNFAWPAAGLLLFLLLVAGGISVLR